MQLKLNSPIYVGLLLFCLITITGVSSAEKLDMSFVSQYNDLYSDNSITNALVTQAQNFSGHYGGSVYNVAVAGNYAYVGQGQDMLVIDITDPSNPSRVGRVTTPALVNNVALSGNYAYVANGENGLVIVDVTNKTTPTIRGTYDSESAYGVAVSGNYTYVADGSNGLVIVDVSNPDAPSLKGSRNTAGYSSNVVVSGNYAYIADGADGLVVIDITNPANPTIEATHDTSGDASDVAISGNYTYVSDGSNGLVIIDITDPAHPTTTGTLDIGDTAEGVAVSGNYTYIAYMENDLPYLGVVDITNKASPTRISAYDDTPGYAYDVAVSGNYAYTAFGRSGLAVINVSNPASPHTAGEYNASGFASGVAVSGNYAYLAYGYMGLTIVDVSNKESPTREGSYITTGYARDVAVADNYAYIADDSYGLVIIDVTNKASPTLKGHYDTSGRSWGVTISGNYAYIADGANGLVIINITNKASPTLVGSCDTPGNAETVAIKGDYAYVADGESGLTIINISHPAAPTIEQTYDTAGHSYGISVVSNYAYIADGSNGLVILNVTNPATPTSMGSYDTSGAAENIVISGNYAYIADDSNGLVIVNVTNPASPAFEDSYDTAGYGYGVAISGSYVYVADFGNGLVILHVDTVPDTTAPACVIGLNEVNVGSSWINWTWTNPTDEDFNYATVYIDGAFVENTSTGYYNLTGLSEGTAHTISTKTVDTSGNINSTWVNDSASTTIPADITAPASVTNLGETAVDSSWIRWTWTNPADVDFSHVMVYLNGTFIANTTDSSISYYNATGLSEGATYTIGIQTVDSSGNINSTTVSDSAITRNYPVVSGVSGTDITKTSITLTWAASDDTTTVQISRNDVVIGNVTGTTSYVDGSLTSGTTYRYTLVPYNQDGLEGEAVSVSLRTSSGSSGGSSGGSSSGGSGGATSVEDFANVATKDVAKAYLRINTTATYQFTKEGNPIQSISLYSLKNSGEIVSTVEVLNNRSKLVNSTPEGNIYQYVNMWVGKAGFATASSIKDSHVKFKVNASWIEQMGVSPSDVKLQRYNGNAWKVLPTTIVSNTTDYVVFESQTPGFSQFVITAEKVVLTASNGNVQSSNETKIPVSNVTQTEDDHKEETQSTASIWTIIVAILVIGFAVVGYTYLKKEK